MSQIMTFLKVAGINCRKLIKSQKATLHNLELNGRFESNP